MIRSAACLNIASITGMPRSKLHLVYYNHRCFNSYVAAAIVGSVKMSKIVGLVRTRATEFFPVVFVGIGLAVSTIWATAIAWAVFGELWSILSINI